MIEGRPDWVLSRQRAWGVPLTCFTKVGAKPTDDDFLLRTAEVNARIRAAFEADGADVWYKDGFKHQMLHGIVDPEAYTQVFDVLDLQWLWEAIGGLPRGTRWQTQARAALRDDLVTGLIELTSDALKVGGASEWFHRFEGIIGTSVAIFTDLRRVDVHDLTTLTVAVRQLRTLALLA